MGLKTPNLLGLYDMSGNVWEWCNDKGEVLGNYERLIKESQKDPITSALINPTNVTHDNLQVIIRGGSWKYNGSYCRVSSRNFNFPSSNDDYVGFRCIRYD